MSEKRKSTSSRLVVAAIDIGTTYSGYAYSYTSDWTEVFINRWEGGQKLTHKAPTALLLNPDKSFNSFGYEAVKTYANIATEGDDEGGSYKEYHFFHRFKMRLTTSFMERVYRETRCTDENGRELMAMEVFAHSIRYLKNHLLQNLSLDLSEPHELKISDIDFVLTVPAIWDDTAKMFMREAAIMRNVPDAERKLVPLTCFKHVVISFSGSDASVRLAVLDNLGLFWVFKAGIPGNQLEIALEPEAASIYCHLMHLDETQRDNTTNSFIREPGVKYMVVNLGGGTADITVHQQQENKTLAKIVLSYGGEWGGNDVDRAYGQFLEDIFGSSVLKTFERDPEYIIDYYEFWQNFEVRKKISSMKSNKIYLSIPVALTEIAKNHRKIKGNQPTVMVTCLRESKYCRYTGIYIEGSKLTLPTRIFENFFWPTINKLVDHLSKMFRDELDSDVNSVLFVGGFSECELVQEELKRRFGDTKRLVFPDEASLAVLKGAVYFGHYRDLVAKFTYGFQIWPKFDESKHSIDRKRIVNGEERCRDVFLKIFAKGDPITPGLKKSQFFKPLKEGENVLDCGVFVSNQKNPTYIDDPGCVKLGTVAIPLTKNDRLTNAEIEESIILGDTYIKVTAYNCRTKQKNERIFDLLSPEIHLPSNNIEI